MRFLRWFCLVLTTSALMTWITFSTLNATILNPEAVKSWLRDSHTYATVFDKIIVPAPADANAAPDSFAVSPAALGQAFSATFSADYLQQHTEQVITQAYAWLRGEAPNIKFSIPIQEKQAAFKENLARAIELDVAKLPQCSGFASSAHCIPPGSSAAAVANSMASQGVDQQQLLAQPLTEKSLINPAAQPDTTQLTLLRGFAAFTPLLVLVLPIIAVFFAAVSVWISPVKLEGASLLGRRVFVAAVLPLAVGVGLLFFGANVSLSFLTSAGTPEASVAHAVLTPIAQAALPGIGRVLALHAGAVALVSAVLWAITHRLHRAHQWQAMRTPPSPPPAEPPAPTPTPSEPPRI